MLPKISGHISPLWSSQGTSVTTCHEHQEVLIMPFDLSADYRVREWSLAQDILSDFVIEEAAATKGRLGFGWVAQHNAPSTYPDLCAAYQHSVRTGEPLPISSENNDSII